MADEGFHEIQLTGKQLVFLFMALTIGAVVAFLAGVMVGRDLPGRAVAVQAAEAPVDPTAALAVPAPTSTVTSTDTPVSALETLTYAERLEAPSPPPEMLGEPVEPAPAPAAPAVVGETRTPAAASAAPPPEEISAELREPPGSGWAVQVTAVKRPEAEAIARRLKGKGYPAFVTSRPNGLFAVRIGKFDNLRAAEDTAARLRKEEQFNPWVTR